MRTHRSRSARLAVATALAALLAAAGAGAQEQSVSALDEAGWQGVLGVRTPVSTAQRYVIVLDEPSLAQRVRAEGGGATEARMRAWTAASIALQEQFLARLSAAGARVVPEFRYVRVLNGFSSRLDPTSLALLEDDPEVAGIYPVRIAYPAQATEIEGVGPSAVSGLDVPGLDGSGVTVALLDTGVDPSHPYLRGSVLSGVDVIDPGSGGIAQPHPTIPGRPERHATELAGIISGDDGPGGLQGVAPGATIFPVRVAGWQPDSEGGYTVYSRTDQIVAGLEVAVDPNGDGDTLDAARVALIGVAEPYASFAGGPLPDAIENATTLDVLVVTPAGNDGRAGPAYGSIAGPGGSPAALTVGATDARVATPTVRVHVRAGLRVLFDGPLPLGGSPTDTVTGKVVPVTRASAARGVAGLFTEGGLSTVAGAMALLPRGVLSEETVEETVAAGAVGILVDGLLPAGAFSLDVPRGIPVVGLPAPLVRELRSMLAAGIPVTAAIGSIDVVENEESGAVAAFSSHGLALGGLLKPELVAAGVAVPTSEPSRSEEGEVRFGTVSGTSAAAAVVAGAAAVLAEGRPRVGAAGLRGLLVGSARRTDLDSAASGAGLVDLRTAVQLEVAAIPAVLSFGPAAPGTLSIERPLRIRNLSTRRVEVSLESVALAPKGVSIAFDPASVELRPGGSADVVVSATASELSADAGVATGDVVLRVAGAQEAHVPWAVAVPARGMPLVSRLTIRETRGRISDETPAILGLVAGSVTATPDPQMIALSSLDVQLVRGEELLGVLARRRELLPGRYTFGLTGRGPDGERLARGTYTVRVVGRSADGARRQVATVPYVVR
jgi:subtilisin family serine protease